MKNTAKLISIPRFNNLRMGNDHTSGSRKGVFSMEIALADNDLAVVMFIEQPFNQFLAMWILMKEMWR